MSAKLTPESILHQIAQLHRMDHGTLNVIRQGPHGPYYNHQCYETAGMFAASSDKFVF